MFATPYRVTWDYYFIARNHTLKIQEWEEGELEYVRLFFPIGNSVSIDASKDES